MTYCTGCGTPIQDNQNFCAGCGTVLGGANPADQMSADTSSNVGTFAPQTSEATLRKLATLKAQAQPPAKNSGKKILIAVLAVFLVGAIAAVAGVVYVGYRVKQKASAALDKFEGNADAHKTTGKAGSGDSSKSNPGDNADGSSGSDADNPLSSVLGKLQGSDGGRTSPMGNMAKSILEDAGVKNPDMPPNLVRNIPYSALTNPLPCPTGAQIDPANLAAGRIQFKPGTILTTSWSLPLADAESDNIIQSVSPESLVFEFSGVAALGLDMNTRATPILTRLFAPKTSRKEKPMPQAG